MTKEESDYFEEADHTRRLERKPSAADWISDLAGLRQPISSAAGLVFPSSGALLLRKAGSGFLGLVHVFAALALLSLVSFLAGVGLVQLFLEEPVSVSEKLHFDYTDLRPKAVLEFGGKGVPVGHTLHVSLLLFMPESDFNRDTGVFQVYLYERCYTYRGIFTAGCTAMVGRPAMAGGAGQQSVVRGGVSAVRGGVSAVRGGSPMVRGGKDGQPIYRQRSLDLNPMVATSPRELLSENGEAISKSSQPCMLRFRSLPIRLTRSFLLFAPLLAGVSTETQKIKLVEVLKHKEGGGRAPRSKSIRVALAPRAGTWSAPQVSEAEIVVRSQLPWRKQLVRNWKWTLSVWTSFCVYAVALVVFFLCRFGSFFALPPGREEDYRVKNRRGTSLRRSGEQNGDGGGETTTSAAAAAMRFRRWQQSRMKRKEALMEVLNRGSVEFGGRSASSFSVSLSREDTGSGVGEDEEVGDSDVRP